MNVTRGKDLLVNNHLRITRARVGLIAVLATHKEPLDVESLVAALRRQKVNADTATVYRTLETFHSRGIVDKITLREGKFRYELTRGDHHHMICERCGTIADIDTCPIDEIVARVERSEKFQAHRHTFELYGLCATCQGAFA